MNHSFYNYSVNPKLFLTNFFLLESLWWRKDEENLRIGKLKEGGTIRGFLIPRIIVILYTTCDKVRSVLIFFLNKS